ncbi:hypothetical protein BB558_002750 [Smittium angustum]|uniref:Uncharacterized protein n=1 Tax=Smittium angustum TaxID=133377 RepID=A0A2U1J7R6_SMIAN|nr:hypothetical protein BB558_002750 [Smittium angustum]
MQRNFLKGENVGESEPKQPENNIQQRVLQGYKHLSEDLENKKLCKCVQMVRMYQAELQRNLDEGTNSLDNKNRSLQFALRKAYMEMIFENPRFARENYIDSLLWQKTGNDIKKGIRHGKKQFLKSDVLIPKFVELTLSILDSGNLNTNSLEQWEKALELATIQNKISQKELFMMVFSIFAGLGVKILSNLENENILQILEFSMTIFTRTMFVFLERFNQTNIRFSYPAENLKGDRKLDFGYFTPLTIGIIWLVALLEKLDSERKDLVQAVRKVVGAEWFVLALDFTTKIIKNSKQKGKQNVGNLNCQNECLILLIDGWILPNGKRWNEMFYTEPKNEFGKINSKERMKNVAKARNGEGMTIGEVLLVDKLMKGIETISEAMKKEQKGLELETENKHFLFEEEEDKSEDDEVIVFSGKFRK